MVKNSTSKIVAITGCLPVVKMVKNGTSKVVAITGSSASVVNSFSFYCSCHYSSPTPCWVWRWAWRPRWSFGPIWWWVCSHLWLFLIFCFFFVVLILLHFLKPSLAFPMILSLHLQEVCHLVFCFLYCYAIA